jgi:hypothetical protein
MQLTCPCCHAKYPLEAATEEEAAGELQLLLVQAGPLARPLVAYLGLFRAKSRALSYERACRLVREVLALGTDPRAIAAALTETVEALRRKRDEGKTKPLKDHKYLLVVLESTTPPAPLLNQEGGAERRGVVGKRRQAIELLAAWAGNDWLRVEIAHGLQALTALPHLTPPGTDAVELTAGVFETVIRRRVNIAEVDSGRVTAAFAELLKMSLKEWPEPAAVLSQLPARPDRKKLAEPGPTEEARAAGMRAAAEIRSKL